MAKKKGVETPTLTVEAVEGVEIDENTIEVKEPLKTAYRASYNIVRKARTNLPVYEAADSDKVVGVFVKDTFAQFTGNYVELDGELYYELEKKGFKGFIKGTKYLY